MGAEWAQVPQRRVLVLSSGPVVEPDAGVSWVLALTMWREESGEPVSCREAFDEMASRVSGMSEFLVGWCRRLFPGRDKCHIPGETPEAGQLRA